MSDTDNTTVSGGQLDPMVQCSACVQADAVFHDEPPLYGPEPLPHAVHRAMHRCLPYALPSPRTYDDELRDLLGCWPFWSKRFVTFNKSHRPATPTGETRAHDAVLTRTAHRVAGRSYTTDTNGAQRG